jgi:hypothetical protein
MKRRFLFCFILFAAPVVMQAQQIIFSEPYREDGQTMNFEILGRMNGNIVIFKNVRWHYAVNVFNDSMVLKEKVDLDFLPGKTFNVDCITYPDYFFLIYQYQKKGILYCMGVKMDANGKKMNEPVELDTTHIGAMGDNKIYSTINSDDKKNIVVFKIQRKDDHAHFLIKHYNSQLELQHQSRLGMEYEDRRNTFGDFFVDNDGNFVFTTTERRSVRENAAAFSIITKAPSRDTFRVKKVPFENAFLDEVKLKIDNVNKKYILNSFYYKEKSGNIEGLFNFIWDVNGDSSYASVFSEFNDELKAIAKSSGSARTAFNDFFIRNIVLKKDGSYILSAEDHSSQSTGINNWNRYDYLYGSPYFSPFNYYSYSPSYYGLYRPFSSFNNMQGIRFYYDNILVLSISSKGVPEWTNVIHKQQYTDDNDNYLSYNTFTTSGELHFIFNDISRRDKLLSDNVVTPDGNVRRSPTLRTYERGYEFMPRYAKQIGARQVIIPSTYRGQICFAKVDF